MCLTNAHCIIYTWVGLPHPPLVRHVIVDFKGWDWCRVGNFIDPFNIVLIFVFVVDLQHLQNNVFLYILLLSSHWFYSTLLAIVGFLTFSLLHLLFHQGTGRLYNSNQTLGWTPEVLTCMVIWMDSFKGTVFSYITLFQLKKVKSQIDNIALLQLLLPYTGSDFCR